VQIGYKMTVTMSVGEVYPLHFGCDGQYGI